MCSCLTGLVKYNRKLSLFLTPSPTHILLKITLRWATTYFLHIYNCLPPGSSPEPLDLFNHKSIPSDGPNTADLTLEIGGTMGSPISSPAGLQAP